MCCTVRIHISLPHSEWMNSLLLLWLSCYADIFFYMYFSGSLLIQQPLRFFLHSVLAGLFAVINLLLQCVCAVCLSL